MILGLKIVVGIIFGLLIINTTFWIGVGVVYLAITIFESIGKWLTK